jgi:hypothetical protein
MSIFTNSFFSAAGQKERLTNVVNTLKAAVTGKGVQAHTGIKALDTTLSAAASHPFLTAAAASVAVAPKAAVAAGKAVISAAGPTLKSIATAHPIATTATVIASPAIVSTVVTSSKLRTALVNAPKTLVSAGTSLGSAIDNQSEIIGKLASGQSISREEAESSLKALGVVGAVGLSSYGLWKAYKTYFPEYYKEVGQEAESIKSLPKEASGLTSPTVSPQTPSPSLPPVTTLPPATPEEGKVIIPQKVTKKKKAKKKAKKATKKKKTYKKATKKKKTYKKATKKKKSKYKKKKKVKR